MATTIEMDVVRDGEDVTISVTARGHGDEAELEIEPDVALTPDERARAWDLIVEESAAQHDEARMRWAED